MSDSSYDSSQFSVERATSGLVLALYLGAAIFLIVIVWMVMRTMPSTESAPEDSDSAARTVAPVPTSPATSSADAEPLLASATAPITSSSNLSQ